MKETHLTVNDFSQWVETKNSNRFVIHSHIPIGREHPRHW